VACASVDVCASTASTIAKNSEKECKCARCLSFNGLVGQLTGTAESRPETATKRRPPEDLNVGVLPDSRGCAEALDDEMVPAQDR
jgi:hypothetical protein